MEAELSRYHTATETMGSDLSSAAYGGTSFTYGPRRDMNLQQWQEAIQEAFYQLGDTRFDDPSSNMGAARLF